MKEFLGKQVTEEEHGMGIAYLLDNNELFYDIGYKVMQNLEETYLLKCHRLKYNGKIKLVYFTKEYVTAETVLANAMPEVKEAADRLADSNDEEGVARFIEKYILKTE